jgi:hypothetical protein
MIFKKQNLAILIAKYERKEMRQHWNRHMGSSRARSPTGTTTLSVFLN